MMNKQVALVMGSSALFVLHLQGCSSDDDDDKETRCLTQTDGTNFTFDNAAQIIALGNENSQVSQDLPNCATCAAGKLGGSGLNGNGYCNADGGNADGYTDCNYPSDGDEPITNGFPIEQNIDFGATGTWPNNLNGVVQALADCGANFDLASLLPLPEAVAFTCLGVESGTSKPGNVAGLDADEGCGKCIVNQLLANGCNFQNDCIPGNFSFANENNWPDDEDLKRAFAGEPSSSAQPSNGFPGCGGTWQFD